MHCPYCNNSYMDEPGIRRQLNQSGCLGCGSRAIVQDMTGLFPQPTSGSSGYYGIETHLIDPNGFRISQGWYGTPSRPISPERRKEIVIQCATSGSSGYSRYDHEYFDHSDFGISESEFRDAIGMLPSERIFVAA